MESLLNLLYAITAGIAASNPKAVAKRASAIPGATIARLVFLEIAIDWNEFIIPHTVPNKPIKGAVDPIVARKVKFFSTFFSSVSVAISNIRSTLAVCIAVDCLFVFINSAIAALNISVAGSFELTGRLLLKLSADFAFQNFFSKSSVDLFIDLKSLNLSKINAHEKIELNINKIITNLTTKSALKNRLHKVKSEAPPRPTT